MAKKLITPTFLPGTEIPVMCPRCGAVLEVTELEESPFPTPIVGMGGEFYKAYSFKCYDCPFAGNYQYRDRTVAAETEQP